MPQLDKRGERAQGGRKGVSRTDGRVHAASKARAGQRRPTLPLRSPMAESGVGVGSSPSLDCRRGGPSSRDMSGSLNVRFMLVAAGSEGMLLSAF